jgi:hypothetical protein
LLIAKSLLRMRRIESLPACESGGHNRYNDTAHENSAHAAHLNAASVSVNKLSEHFPDCYEM